MALNSQEQGNAQYVVEHIELQPAKVPAPTLRNKEIKRAIAEQVKDLELELRFTTEQLIEYGITPKKLHSFDVILTVPGRRPAYADPKRRFVRKEQTLTRDQLAAKYARQATTYEPTPTTTLGQPTFAEYESDKSTTVVSEHQTVTGYERAKSATLRERPQNTVHKPYHYLTHEGLVNTLNKMYILGYVIRTREAYGVNHTGGCDTINDTIAAGTYLVETAMKDVSRTTLDSVLKHPNLKNAMSIAIDEFSLYRREKYTEREIRELFHRFHSIYLLTKLYAFYHEPAKHNRTRQFWKKDLFNVYIDELSKFISPTTLNQPHVNKMLWTMATHVARYWNHNIADIITTLYKSTIGYLNDDGYHKRLKSERLLTLSQFSPGSTVATQIEQVAHDMLAEGNVPRSKL